MNDDLMQASWTSELDQQKQKQLSERSMKFEALQTTLHTTLDSQRCATLTTGSEKPTEPLFHDAEDCAMSHATTLTTVPMSMPFVYICNIVTVSCHKIIW